MFNSHYFPTYLNSIKFIRMFLLCSSGIYISIYPASESIQSKNEFIKFFHQIHYSNRSNFRRNFRYNKFFFFSITRNLKWVKGKNIIYLFINLKIIFKFHVYYEIAIIYLLGVYLLSINIKFKEN